MEIKQKRSTVNQGIIVLLGVIILICSVLIYLFILRGVFGKFSTASLLPNSESIKNIVLGGDTKVAILYSKYTENMLPEGSSWLNDNISTWKKFLDNSKVRYDVISDVNIENGKLFDYGLLVLPGSKSLSDREIIQIKKFIDNGGSIFATSGTASYSDDGKWRGWEFFSEVFGLKFSKEIEPSEVTKVHTLRGGFPITANIPTGFPLKVATWDRPMSVEVLDPRTTQVSFWYNYKLESGLVREGIKQSAGIAYGTYGKGRFVWMGFEINSVIGVQEDYIYFDRLFQNSLNWLTYGPVSYVREWPTGYDAAAVITPVLSENVNNVRNLTSILKSERVGATFFVSEEKANQYPDLVKSLSGYGEIGALVDVGYLASITDTVNKLNSYDMQYDYLRSAKATIEKITNSPVRGCLPYYGLFDNNTVMGLINSGYSYVLTDSLTDRSVPKTLIRGDKRLISITKTARDDYEVIRDFNLTIPEFQFYTYQEDVDRVLFEGGLYILKMHTEYQCKPENVKVVKDVIQDLKRKNFWIATASQVEDWYRKRDYVEIRTQKRGDTRIAVTISNPGKETVNSLVVQVDLNENAEDVSLSTEIIGTKKAKVSHDKGSKSLTLYLDNLEPKESRTYYIDYDRVKA